MEVKTGGAEVFDSTLFCVLCCPEDEELALGLWLVLVLVFVLGLEAEGSVPLVALEDVGAAVPAEGAVSF